MQGLNPPNPRMSVMAMEDGFTIHSGAFGDSVPMTNYTESELGIKSETPGETFSAEEDTNSTVTETGDLIPGMQVQPEKPGVMDILKNFNDWIAQNLGYTIIGLGVVAFIYSAGARKWQQVKLK